jgi:two-component system, sensor histidine kinase and response regulator
MDENHNYSAEELNSVINTTWGVNGNKQSNGISYAIDGEKKGPLNPLMLRLQKMELLNADLVELLDQQTERLDEVVSANTKSISVIAHDLRIPFSGILAALEMMKDNLVNHNADELERYIDIASDSAHSAINLLDNLVQWAMLQNNGLEFNPVKINLKEYIEGEIENINISAKQKQISLNCSITPDLNVYIDLQMVSTVLRNLISNAIKFTDTGGNITVSARKCSPYVEIVVTDNGMGISSEDQKSLFNNENIQLGPLTRNRQGLGLGLKLCREFAERHGGHISFESKLGKGSKFKFSLPCNI